MVPRTLMHGVHTPLRPLTVRLAALGLLALAAPTAGCGDDPLTGGDAQVDSATASDATAATASDATATTSDDATTATADAVTDVVASDVDRPIVDLPDVGATDATLADAPPGDDGADGPFGGDRPAKVVLPVGYDAGKSWPLVLLLHGYSADGQLQDLYLGFSKTASEAGFITIVPDGTTDLLGVHFWNADPAWCCNFEHSEVDDDGYLVGLVAEAARRWHVDPSRVYAFGHSNGGFMAHELACRHADVFAAVGALAGSLPMAASACAPSEPVSVLQIHGTLDAVILYGGDLDYPGALAIADRWHDYDGCVGLPWQGLPVDYDLAMIGPETAHSEWPTCDAGTSVALWTMAGSGHVPIVAGGDFVGDVLAWLDAHRKAKR